MKLLTVLLFTALSANATQMYLNFQNFSDDGGETINHTFIYEVQSGKDYDCTMSSYDEDEEREVAIGSIQIMTSESISVANITALEGDMNGSYFSSNGYAQNLKGLYAEMTSGDGYTFSEVSLGSFEQYTLRNSIASSMYSEVIDLSKSQRVDLTKKSKLDFDFGHDETAQITLECEIENI